MKKIIFLFALSLIFIVKSNAQNWTYSVTTTTGATNPIYLKCSGSYPINFGTGGTDQMQLTTNGDLDILGSGNGYQIDGSYVLWNNNIITSTYVGVVAGNNTGTGTDNTFLGYGAGPVFSSGSDNTFLGMETGNDNTSGTENTFVGSNTGLSNTQGNYNSFLGYFAGYSNTTGSWNTIMGYQCGEHNISANGNSFYGKDCGLWNTYGAENSFFGAHSSAANVNGDSSVSMGFASETGNIASYSNVIIGDYADINGGNTNASNYNVMIGARCSPSHQTGDYNVLLGWKSDLVDGVVNSCAIGASAVAVVSNNFILGNNAQNVGIGMSNISGGALNRLEISYSSAAASTYSTSVAPVSSFSPIGTGTATGASGLQFRDLTAASTEYSYVSSQGFLTVDNSGNVVYMGFPNGNGGIGTCSSPTTLPASGTGAIDLNGGNFFFLGNGAGSSADNVNIGVLCSGSQMAKLQVNQSSGSYNTIGEYVENLDASSGSVSSPQPVIGLQSQMPYSVGSQFYPVAGWFDADGDAGSSYYYGYAIFVPHYPGGVSAHTGGTVDLGYDFGSDVPDYLLDVNDYARIDGTVIPSDSNLKTNVSPFTYGIKAIRNLNPVSYNYSGKGGFNTSNRYIGLLAQNLQRNVPSAVLSSKINDTVTHSQETILNIYEEGVLYTAVNAIKQLDSTVTSNHKADSLIQSKQQLTIDSLRAIVTNIQNRLNQGSSSTGDNPTITSEQNVTLGSTDAPLLYQNTPNPFSTGTKINYYLPQGTIGASIMFYDTYGNQIKTIQLSQTGNGTLNVTPDNLANGIYAYSLVVNGAVIDTKKMLLQK